MRHTRSPHHLLAVLVVGAALVAGCGDDGGGGGDDDRSVPTTSVADTGNDAGAVAGSGVAEAIGGEGVTDALDAVGLDGKGSALVSATGADRYEVDGDVLHLYLGDGARVPEGTECMVVMSILSEGEQAVVHRAGAEVSCE